MNNFASYQHPKFIRPHEAPPPTLQDNWKSVKSESDIPPEDWERELKREGLPEHVTRHLVTMAELHRAGRYDRQADGVEWVTGRPPMSVREFVSLHAEEFGGRRS